jgi:hypothetical protein
MIHLAEKQFFWRANSALLIAIVGGGLLACVFGATVYDIGHWLTVW